MYQNIDEAANAINREACNYCIGNLQGIRKRLRSLGCAAGSDIFRITSVMRREGYAYHWGGRKELQFNIRFIEKSDCNYIEFGLAFSLEYMWSINIVNELRPRIERFNEFIDRCNGDFSEVYSKVVDEKKQRAYPLVSQNTKIPQPREKGHAHARIYPIRSRKYSARYTE